MHVRYPNNDRLFTARNGATRSIIKWVVAVGVAGVKLVGFSKGIQCIGEVYD